MYFINKLSYIETNNSIRVSTIELFISFNEYLRERVQNFSSSLKQFNYGKYVAMLSNHKFLKIRYLVISRLTGFTNWFLVSIKLIKSLTRDRYRPNEYLIADFALCESRVHTHERSTRRFCINCKSDFILFSRCVHWLKRGRFMEFLKGSPRRDDDWRPGWKRRDIVVKVIIVIVQSRFYIRNNRSPLKAGLNFSSSFLFFSSFPFFLFSRRKREIGIKKREKGTAGYKFLSPYFATSLKSCRFFISPRYICYRVRSRELYQWTTNSGLRSFSPAFITTRCSFPPFPLPRRFALLFPPVE